MNSLPQEILDHISFTHFRDCFEENKIVPPVDLPYNRSLLATISRRWQWAIERQSFKRIACKSTELDIFERVVVGYRRRFLKFLEYTIILPYYTPKSCTVFEREADRTANDVAFTTAIHRLFYILHSWGGKSETGSPYLVYISVENIYSPMDYGYHSSTIDSSGMASFKPVRALTDTDGDAGNLRDLQQHRFEYSSLRLLHPPDLPIVPAIRSFNINTRGSGYGVRIVSPVSLLQIAMRLPNSSMCRIYAFDRLLNYPTLRRTERDNFARALKHSGFPKSVERLFVSLFSIEISDQGRYLVPSTPLGVSHDPLSSALRETTGNLPHLNRLSIKGALDLSLLWSSTSLRQPFWQHLQDLEIKFDLTTPMGEWYFLGAGDTGDHPHPVASSVASEMPPGHGFTIEEDLVSSRRFSTLASQRQSGISPTNYFRTKVNERLMSPLIEAFAKACIQIPVLERASLKTMLFEIVEFAGVPTHCTSSWGIYYSAPGRCHNLQCPSTFEIANASRRALVYDVREWRLDEELSGLLRSIGESSHSEDAIEMYIDQWATVGRAMAERRARERQERQAREQQAQEQQVQEQGTA